MSKQLSSCKEIKVIDENVHIKGNLLVDGKIGSKLKPEALVVTQQKDLCQKIFSSFVPIIIPSDATYEELILDLPSLYNRHLEVINLSGHVVRLVVLINSEQKSFQLPNNRHANVTIFATCNLIHTVVDISPPQEEPGCVITYILGDQTFIGVAMEIINAIISQSGSTVSASINILLGAITLVFSENSTVIGTVRIILISGGSVDIISDNVKFCAIILETLDITPSQQLA